MPYVFSEPPQVAFYRQADPVRAYFSALQQFLHVPVTGVWDFATHDALRIFCKRVRPSNEIGEWGRDPGKVARNAVLLATPSAAAELQNVQLLLGLLGLPNSLEGLRAEIDSILSTTASIEDTIRIAENTQRRPGPQSPATGRKEAQFTSVGLVAAGVAAVVLLTALVWKISRKR